jgi:hypothetical protein
MSRPSHFNTARRTLDGSPTRLGNCDVPCYAIPIEHLEQCVHVVGSTVIPKRSHPRLASVGTDTVAGPIVLGPSPSIDPDAQGFREDGGRQDKDPRRFSHERRKRLVQAFGSQILTTSVFQASSASVRNCTGAWSRVPYSYETARRWQIYRWQIIGAALSVHRNKRTAKKGAAAGRWLISSLIRGFNAAEARRMKKLCKRRNRARLHPPGRRRSASRPLIDVRRWALDALQYRLIMPGMTNRSQGERPGIRKTGMRSIVGIGPYLARIRYFFRAIRTLARVSAYCSSSKGASHSFAPQAAAWRPPFARRSKPIVGEMIS